MNLKRLLAAAMCVVVLAVCGGAASAEGFAFRPKVSSVYLDEIFGETMVRTWFNLVDAVMAGEDQFACPDQDTYDWVIHQFPERCFPLLTELIDVDWRRPVKDGVGYLTYRTSREEFDARLAAFEAQVEGILNETMEPDYSDVEKALALYRYFSENYQYDYDTMERMSDEYVEEIRCFRFMEGGIGVCQEIAAAYSYLLMEAGVNATIMMGDSKLQNTGHAWSYVRINGNNYHIDPTYALCTGNSLEFFMMTDEKRSEEYLPENYVIASCYTQDHPHPDYAADDDAFSPLWDAYLDRFDPDADMIYAHRYDDGGEWAETEFSYRGL